MEITRKLLALLVAILLTSCSAPASTKAPTKAPVVSSKVCPEITEKSGSIDYDYLTIEGTVKNTCTHSISYVEIAGYALNDAGTEVGNDWTYADSDVMSAGAESQFTIMIKVPSSATKYKVKILDWND